VADTQDKRNITEQEWSERRKLAILCRILGRQNAIGVYGHVSLRVPDSDIVLITPGAGTEKTAVRTDQIFVFDIHGKMLFHPGGDRPMQIPAEWRIHTQIHKDRPEVGCVAHLHAHASTLLGIAGRDIKPVFSQASFLAGGVPTYDNPRMVLDDAAAVALSKALGKSVACQMRGHGSVVVGTTAENALAACIFIEENAQYQIEAETLGGVKPFPDDVWQALADERRGEWGGRLVWQFWERRVLSDGQPL
jgi:ribulose-5-phosphate 4-epimerase/fuculose-1-phosphate aldolase